MRTTLLLVSFVSLTACSMADMEDDGDLAGGKADGLAQADSLYTSVEVDDCTTIDASWLHPDPEIDFYEGECAGKGGYVVNIGGGDLRYDLDLTFEGTTIELPSPASFHDLGSSKIEWRFVRTGPAADDVEFTSLIYRLDFQDIDPATDEFFDNTALVVVRLDGASTCPIGWVERSADMNVKARQLADDASAPCVEL